MTTKPEEIQDTIMQAWLAYDAQTGRDLAHVGLAQIATQAVADFLSVPAVQGTDQSALWVAANRFIGFFIGDTDPAHLVMPEGIEDSEVDFINAYDALSDALAASPAVRGEGRVPENRKKLCDQLMILHDKLRSGIFGQREVWEQWLRDAVAALSPAPPAPAPEGGEIETALRQVWSDWEIAADAAEVDDYQIKDVAPETVEAVAHALGFLLPAPRTPQTACLGGVEGLTSEPCPKCGATEDDDCKAPFPAPPAPAPEGGEIETALRQVWSDWEIAADAAEVDDYQIKDVAPETVEAVAHALGFLLPAPRTPQTACLGGVEGLTSEPCPKCGATEDDDCKAPFPAPPAPTPEGEWRPDVDEIARAICGHPRGCQLALGLCDQCKDDINVLGVLKAAARVAAVPAPPVAEPIVAEESQS